MFELKDKVAIVTGGNSGIGKATALLFARQGAKLVITARRAEKLAEVEEEIRSLGGDVISVSADVSKPASAVDICHAAKDAFGRIDILVNSAGQADFNRPITGTTDEFFDQIVKVDQYSVFYMCREAVKYMQEQGRGVIVNVGSVGGIYHNSGFPYAAAKAAVVGMTRNMAIQFADEGIRINCVCPGGTDTPMIEEIEKGDKMLPCDIEFDKKTSKHLNVDLPLCTPEEQANAILFMASDEASGITGQCLVVDNGAWI